MLSHFFRVNCHIGIYSYASLVWDIKDLLQLPLKDAEEVNHTLEKAHAYSNFLANREARRDEPMVFISSPLEGLSISLLAYAMNVSFLSS